MTRECLKGLETVNVGVKPAWWLLPVLRALYPVHFVLGYDRTMRLGAWFIERGLVAYVRRS